MKTCLWFLAVFSVCLAQTPAPPAATPPTLPDLIKPLVDRLDLERYKSTIKSLTQFGDRRQGTDRNRSAIDWIEAQLKSYGCTNTERVTYNFEPPAGRTPNADAGNTAAPGRTGRGPARGGGKPRGVKARTGVNNDPNAQPDEKLRALNTPPSTPGERAGSFSAPKSAPSIPRKCTSSAPTWMASDGAKRLMTMARAPPWSWKSRASSAARM